MYFDEKLLKWLNREALETHEIEHKTEVEFDLIMH